MAATRREKGAGTLAQRAPGTWQVRVGVGTDPATGRPRRITRTVHGSRTDALRVLRELTAQAQRGQFHPALATVDDLLTRWLAHLERAGIAPATLDTYRIICRSRISPALGDLRLRELTPARLDAFCASLLRSYAPRTVRLTHAVISSALTQAVRWQWIASNPARAATPPRARRRDEALTPLSSATVRELIERAEGDGDPDLAMAIMLGAITGARRGELCGLRWSDIDWQERTLRVRRALVRARDGERIGRTGGLRQGPPKSGRARTIALSDVGLEALRRYRDILVQRCAALGMSMTDGWMLSDDGGRSPTSPDRLSERAAALGRRCGIRFHVHQLRHLAATELLGAGVDVRTAAGRLGHSPETLLRVYAHWLPVRDRAAAEVLEASVLREQR